MAIEWRWIPGFEGRYKISSEGDVRSEPRRYAGGRALKPRLTRYNPAKGEIPYKVVRLYPGDGTFTDKLVHVVMLHLRRQDHQRRPWPYMQALPGRQGSRTAPR